MAKVRQLAKSWTNGFIGRVPSRNWSAFAHCACHARAICAHCVGPSVLGTDYEANSVCGQPQMESWGDSIAPIGEILYK
jgi:hypothetical protein